MCHNNKKFDEEEQTVKSHALQQQSLCKQKICKYLSYLHITANMVAWSNLPKIFKLLDIGVCTSWIRNIKLHNVWKRLKYRFILINFHWLTQKKKSLANQLQEGISMTPDQNTFNNSHNSTHPWARYCSPRYVLQFWNTISSLYFSPNLKKFFVFTLRHR